MEVKKEALAFYLYSYFGILTEDIKDKKKDTPEDKALKCAQRAYLDLNRTLTFDDKEADYEECKTEAEKERKIREAHKTFSDGISEFIFKKVRDMLESVNKYCTKEDFDKWHCKTLYEIKNKVNDKNVLKEDLSIGQAQKWLNMTIKYMMLLGDWDEKFNKIREFIHVPVDSYIMEAASNMKILLERKNGEYKKYSEGSSKPWSQWHEEEYKKFQDKLRDKLRAKYPDICPIDWEGPAWIEIAEKRKNREQETEEQKSQTETL